MCAKRTSGYGISLELPLFECAKRYRDDII
jgi:hypothetical protein